MNRLDLALFDLRSGNRLAIGVLTRELGRARGLRAALATLARRRGVRRRLTALAPPRDHADSLSASQFTAALSLYEALRLDLELPETEALAVTTNVVAEVGRAFVARNADFAGAAEWAAETDRDRFRAWEKMSEQFFNAETELGGIGRDHLHFRVSRCRFVDLARAAECPELVPAFCAADERYFATRPDAVLNRPATLATGCDCCDFRVAIAPPRAHTPPARPPPPETV